MAAGVFFFILFGIVILYLALLGSSKGILKDRIKYLQDFEQSGFLVSEDYKTNLKKAKSLPIKDLLFYPFLPNWIVTKKGIDFIIRPYSSGDSETASYYFEVSFYLPKNLRYKLSISRRGLFSKVFGINKGQYSGMNQNLNIQGSNLMLVKHLVNVDEHLKELKDVLKLTKLQLHKKISFSVSQTVKSVSDAVDEILEFIDVLRDFAETLDTTKKYTIKEIFEDFNIESIELKCIICFQGVDMNEISIFDCCSSVGHADHVNPWLDNHKKCPFCQNTEFVLYTSKEVGAELKIH